MVIFSFKYRRKEMILVSDNIPSSLGEKTLIDRVEVSNA